MESIAMNLLFSYSFKKMSTDTREKNAVQQGMSYTATCDIMTTVTKYRKIQEIQENIRQAKIKDTTGNAGRLGGLS